MGLLEIASNNSFWRGVDYFKGDKVISWQRINDNHLKGEVEGSGNETYDVLIDIAHPKRSTCNCAHAEGTRRACKHKVAVYLSAFPEELERVLKEIKEWEAVEEERQQEEREEMKRYVYSLSKQELREQLLWRLIEERDNRWY